jgi:rfaE bifunctional protein nucleotidyltransferase chain/domain
MEHRTNVESAAGLRGRVRELRSQGRRIVFTNGCFDVLHPGHLQLLAEAASHGDVLVVGINSDRSVGRLKGPDRPVFPQDERAEVLSALEMVDLVCVFDEDTPLDAIETLRPDVLVKGADWEGDIVGQKEVEGWGGRVVVVGLVKGQSTTGVLGRVQSQIGSRTPDA